LCELQVVAACVSQEPPRKKTGPGGRCGIERTQAAQRPGRSAGSRFSDFKRSFGSVEGDGPSCFGIERYGYARALPERYPKGPAAGCIGGETDAPDITPRPPESVAVEKTGNRIRFSTGSLEGRLESEVKERIRL